MPVGSDFVLLGTGLAPLVAARELILQGKSVLLLNPDPDFCKEDSEIALDPLWPAANPDLSPKRVLELLGPVYPGTVESWAAGRPASGTYRDPAAPYVRSRSRFWIVPAGLEAGEKLEFFENFYLECSEAGLNPQIIDGSVAPLRFPGHSQEAGSAEGQVLIQKGILVPDVCDVDLARYRVGMAEFVREKLDPERVRCEVTQLERDDDGGIRYYWNQSWQHVQPSEKILAFWTPRLTHWIQALSPKRKIESLSHRPERVRIWEEWSLLSRDAIQGDVVGSFEDFVVWAEFEGSPEDDSMGGRRISALRPGAEVDWDEYRSRFEPGESVSSKSFDQLSRLVHEFLNWDRYSIRLLRLHALFEWDPLVPARLEIPGDSKLVVIPRSDGPVFSVVQAARGAGTAQAGATQK